MFDIYLPTVVLTPALLYFQPAQLDPGTTAIFTSLVFVTTLVGRPIGAAVFGALADRIGRRRSTIISVTGFGVITLLIALVPGYTTIGIASFWVLIVLRFLDGICLGGGYTGALPLAMEYSTKSRRGLLGGIILSAFPLAYVVITLVGLASFALFPLAGPDSPYAVWGWRVPFVLGALLAFVLAAYYVRSVSESEIWEAAEAAKSEGTSQGGAGRPLLAVLRSSTFLQVFGMMTGFWLTQNLVTLFLPTTVLRNLVGLSNTQLTVTLLIAYVCLVGSYIASGVIGQRIGRRRFFIIGGLLIATVGVGLMAVLVNGRGLPLGVVILRRLPVLDRRHRTLGRRPALHHRAVPHRRPRLRLRPRVQRVGRDPVLLRLLPRGPRRVHAVRDGRARAARLRRPARGRRRGRGPRDEGRRLRVRGLRPT